MSLLTKAKMPGSIELMILNKTTPGDHRRHLMANLCLDDNPAAQKLAESIIERAAQQSGEMLESEKLKELSELISALKAAPARVATFVRMIDPPPANGHANNGSSVGDAVENGLSFHNVSRAHVILEDGTSAYTVVPDPKIAKLLRMGDTVLVEGQGRMLLYVDSIGPESGEEAQLERRIDAHRIEVMLRDHEKSVCLASTRLQEKLDSGMAVPGSWLLVCARRNMAFDVVPRSDALSHYRFLVKEPVPDVIVERDIGDPPQFIDDIAEDVRMEMTQPELGRRYRVLPCKFVMLSGVSGAGKTLCGQALWRRIYEVMSEVTGIDLDELPRRVLRLRTSDVLSKWYGDSEKRIDKFFDEVEQIAAETIRGVDGKEYPAPTLVICEEADALGRARGDDSVHDRVQNTILERLDVTRQKLRNFPIVFLFSTNLPQLVDCAFLRRVSGISVSFGRLSRHAFCAVLSKHLRDVPIYQNGDDTIDSARLRLKNQVTPWLFSHRGEDTGLVEITYAGATQAELRYRRDFLTGAVVHRAVQEASTQACRDERNGFGVGGLTAAQLIGAFDRQIRAISDVLNPGNVSQYLTLPEGVRVASVRRIPQAPLLTIETTR